MHLNRTLSINFESAFPRKILGWVENNGNNQQQTRAQLRTTMKSAYWEEHNAEHQPLRDSLGLMH